MMRLLCCESLPHGWISRHGALVILLLVCGSAVLAQGQQPKYRVIAFAEENSVHRPFVDAAKVWLEKEAIANKFLIHYIHNTENRRYVSFSVRALHSSTPGHQLLRSRSTLRNAREDGLDFHHATRLRGFEGYPIWRWFSDFMGGIRYKNYIASFVTAKVNAEDQKPPVMRGLGGSFEIEREKWYTRDKSPRPNEHVLASVDENLHARQPPEMGDHSLVWSKEHVKARNAYILMGHRAEHFQNQAFTTLFRNSIFRAVNQ